MTTVKRSTAVAVMAIVAVALASPAWSRTDETKEYDVSRGGTIVFDLEAGGSIVVIGWDKSKAEVSYWESGRGDSHIVDIDVRNGDLRITSEPMDYDGRSKSLSFEVRVPHEFNVEFDSMGGGLELIDLEGKFTGSTMGGGLTLKNVKGKARLTTMGGGVEVKGCDLDGYIKTMGGSVLLEDVVGDLEASSMGGDVRYVNVRDREGDARGPGGVSSKGITKETVAITTMGGSIEVDEAPAGAAVHTMGGDIEIHDASRFVKAKTMGGDIEIEVHDGWVRATTMAGDIEVEITKGLGEGDEGVELQSMSGDITLQIPRDLSIELDLTIAYTRNSRRDYKIVSDWDLDIEHSEDWDYDNGSPRKRIYGRGVVGGGKYPIRIKTINGDIYVRAVD